MDQPIQRRQRILWLNVLTVVSAAILISAEVFGAAFAGSWAIASLFALGSPAARNFYVSLKQKGLHRRREWIISALAQFRTCLWPCVGRWASGQEAGQPPKEETLLPCSRDRQPEAKPAMPALHWRRGLKQRRKGFFGYCRRQCRGHRKGLSIFASSAERDFPHPDQGSNRGDAEAPHS